MAEIIDLDFISAQLAEVLALQEEDRQSMRETKRLLEELLAQAASTYAAIDALPTSLRERLSP